MDADALPDDLAALRGAYYLHSDKETDVFDAALAEIVRLRAAALAGPADELRKAATKLLTEVDAFAASERHLAQLWAKLMAAAAELRAALAVGAPAAPASEPNKDDVARVASAIADELARMALEATDGKTLPLDWAVRLGRVAMGAGAAPTTAEESRAFAAGAPTWGCPVNCAQSRLLAVVGRCGETAFMDGRGQCILPAGHAGRHTLGANDGT